VRNVSLKAPWLVWIRSCAGLHERKLNRSVISSTADQKQPELVEAVSVFKLGSDVQAARAIKKAHAPAKVTAPQAAS
jgi:hypothetical protein